MVAKHLRTTSLIHHAYKSPSGFDAPQIGVYKASTVFFEDVAALHAQNWQSKNGYTYGLQGTPTTFVLEERIASLEGGLHCILVPSGLSAVSLIDMALLAQGDEMLMPDNGYKPGRDLALDQLVRWGIKYRLYDSMDVVSLDAMIGEKTKLVWVEAPGSVTMEFPDVRGLLSVCRRKGVTSALDNTWGAGLAFDGFAVGADIVMQALTKYPSGGGDVLMGSVTTRDLSIHKKLKFAHMRIGFGVGANDAEMVLRSLPTIALRYAAHDASARDLARWLQMQEKISSVLHPALPESPGHKHWAETCSAAAGLFSIVFDSRFTVFDIEAFVNALKLFRIGYSWGGPFSLAVPYDLEPIRSLSTSMKGHVVRLSIGLEDVEDLRSDLAQALSTLA